MTQPDANPVKSIMDELNSIKDELSNRLFKLRQMVQELCAHPSKHVESCNGGTWSFDVCDDCGKHWSKSKEESDRLYREQVAWFHRTRREQQAQYGRPD